MVVIMKHHVVSYEEFKGDCRHLAAILAERKPQNLFGVMRGGMLVALYVAHELGIDADKVFPIYMDTVHAFARSPMRFPMEADVVIDDVFDSGKTQQDLYTSWPWLTLAVLYSKNRKLNPKKLLVGRHLETEDYLILPHEVLPENVERL